MVRLPIAQNPMEPVNFAQAKPSYVQGGHDPSVLGLIPVGSKQTSVIVSNQSLMSDPTAQATTSMAETLAEQTIMAGGNRFVLHDSNTCFWSVFAWYFLLWDLGKWYVLY